MKILTSTTLVFMAAMACTLVSDLFIESEKIRHGWDRSATTLAVLWFMSLIVHVCCYLSDEESP